MRIEEVKKSLNQMVTYKGKENVYRLTACILRRNEEGYFYQAEISDIKSGNSVTICKLEDIEVRE